MKLLNTLQTIERIDALIKRRATGSPKELAGRLGVSERTVYGLIDIMKKMNAPISYNKHVRSYQYDYDGHFGFGFFAQSQIDGRVFGGRGALNFKRFCPLQFFCSRIF